MFLTKDLPHVQPKQPGPIDQETSRDLKLRNQQAVASVSGGVGLCNVSLLPLASPVKPGFDGPTVTSQLAIAALAAGVVTSYAVSQGQTPLIALGITIFSAVAAVVIGQWI